MRAPTLTDRKFLAYMWADVCWTGLIGGGLYRLEQLLSSPKGAAVAQGVGMVTLLMMMVVIKGFLQAGYIGTDAWLDKYAKAVDRLIPDAPRPPPAAD